MLIQKIPKGLKKKKKKEPNIREWLQTVLSNALCSRIETGQKTANHNWHTEMSFSNPALSGSPEHS